MSTRELLADSIARIAARQCGTAVVRRAESGEIPRELLRAIADAGLDRATASESAGGGGLGWRDALPLVQAVGEHAMPVPLAESLAAHAVGNQAGVALPPGFASLALLHADADGALSAEAVPWGDRVASVLGVLPDGRARVLDPARAEARHARNQAGEVRSGLRWPATVVRQSAAADMVAGTGGANNARAAIARAPGASAGTDTVATACAALRAAQLAGAMHSALRMALRYAGEREQFGRPIGRFQAVQQQLALMTELVAQASIAAELAFDTDDTRFDALQAACAKQVASANALQCAAIAHAVHGAIGMTAEHDLNLFTRRLRAWAAEWGGAHHWSHAIGRKLLAGPHDSVWHAVIEASNG